MSLPLVVLYWLLIAVVGAVLTVEALRAVLPTADTARAELRRHRPLLYWATEGALMGLLAFVLWLLLRELQQRGPHGVTRLQTAVALACFAVGFVWAFSRLARGLRERVFRRGDPERAIPVRQRPLRYWVEVCYLIALIGLCSAGTARALLGAGS